MFLHPQEDPQERLHLKERGSADVTTILNGRDRRQSCVEKGVCLAS
jgi:hypothetical protein